MHLTKLRDLRLSQPPSPGQPAHLSAASGLVKIGPTLYVVADDELHLGVFAAAGHAPGEMIRLFAGELPTAPAARKKHKPDLEALVQLPACPSWPQGALLALGSGSRSQRHRAALLPLTPTGVDASAVRALDFTAVFADIEAHIGSPNIEGAVVRGGHLVLMHRGNPNAADNALISLDLAALLRSVAHGGGRVEAPILTVDHYALSTPESPPLGFTDGAMLPDGRLVFTAVAEDTPDSYRDGPCQAAALGVIAANGSLQWLQALDQPHKIEGIHAEIVGSQIQAWLVTDADDANIAAHLLTTTLPLAL